jgi:hypothetical protein
MRAQELLSTHPAPHTPVARHASVARHQANAPGNCQDVQQECRSAGVQVCNAFVSFCVLHPGTVQSNTGSCVHRIAVPRTRHANSRHGYETFHDITIADTIVLPRERCTTRPRPVHLYVVTPALVKCHVTNGMANRSTDKTWTAVREGPQTGRV